jgi:hypothetical protein
MPTRLPRARRAATIVVLLACVAAPAPALAAPVDGGGSFDDAPLLRAGTYIDTILPQETLFYAVALGEGQRLRVDAEVDLSGGSKGERGDADALGGFGLTFYTPLRERLPADYVGPAFRGGSELQSDGDTRRGPRVVGPAVAERRKIAGSGGWIGPGRYTFTAAISAMYADPGAVVEFPLRLQITIQGPAVSVASIGPGPLGRAAAPASAPAGRRSPRARSSSPDDSAGVPDGIVLVAGVGAFLAGALLAGLAGRRSGPSSRARRAA